MGAKYQVLMIVPRHPKTPYKKMIQWFVYMFYTINRASLSSNCFWPYNTFSTDLIKVNLGKYYITIMKWSGWPLTAIIAAISLVISYTLFQLGIYFFFLPLIFFIPFVGFFINRKRSYTCPTCGLSSSGNYCPRCGARL